MAKNKGDKPKTGRGKVANEPRDSSKKTTIKSQIKSGGVGPPSVEDVSGAASAAGKC